MKQHNEKYTRMQSASNLSPQALSLIIENHRTECFWCQGGDRARSGSDLCLKVNEGRNLLELMLLCWMEAVYVLVAQLPGELGPPYNIHVFECSAAKNWDCYVRT